MKFYKIKYTIMILALMAITPLYAQEIIKAEYFFDPDPGAGNGTDIPITPGDTVDINFTPDFSALEPGNYMVFIRVKDENGVWTLFGSRYLIIQSAPVTDPVNMAEYFLDSDPGAGNGTPINILAADSVTLLETIATGDLEPGLHVLYARMKDGNGSWTSMGSWPVRISAPDKTGPVIAAEYFFDNDPGPGNGFSLPIPTLDTIDSNLSLFIPDTLAFGPHTYYIRIQSSDSLWSHYASGYMEVCDTYGPLAGFDYQRGSGRWVSFEDMSGNASSWLWDFDDGNSDTARHPVHQYSLPGVYKVKQYAINDCHTDTLEQEVTIRGILSVETNRGSNSGSVFLVVNGFGFSPGAILRFTREGFDPILPDTFNIVGNEAISARFDLKDKEPGFWNVEVMLPGDTTFVETGGFEILDGGSPQLQVTLNGRREVLVNRTYNYLLTVSNTGFEDAVGIPLVIRDLDSSVEVDISSFDLDSLWELPFYDDLKNYILTNGIDSSKIDYQFVEELSGNQAAAFVIPYVPAGSSLQFQVRLKLTESGGIEPKIAVTPQGYLTSSSLLLSNPLAEPLNCRSGEFRSAVEMAMDTTIATADWENCFQSINADALDYLRSTGMGNNPGEGILPYQGLNGVMAYQILSCLLGSEPDTSLFSNVMMLLNQRFHTLDLIFDEPEDCNAIAYDNLYSNASWETLMNPYKHDCSDHLAEQIFNPVFASKDGCVMCGVRHCMGCGTQAEIEGVNSFDPNVKYGPGNNPYDNYVNGLLGLEYAIYFENADTATAPAATVKISDTLDPEKFDLSSFQFATYGFKNHYFQGEQDGYEMFAIHDLRPERPVYLKMEALIDTATGFAEWIFSSLDTLSLQPTADPFAGFLLPNVDHPEGEGFVSFTVDLKDDLVPGETIDNYAEIYFDLNEPITTEVWSNVFDNDLPESMVLPLPDTVFSESFTLEWLGSDATSGVRYYDIYASTINGADTTQALFRYHTGTTGGTFTGSFGERYYFYSMATDSAGNTEPGVITFDAEVLLWDPCFEPVQVNQYFEICAGDSALIQGTWYTQQGIYYDTLTSVLGCDSLIQSELTVHPLPAQPVISWDGSVLSSTPAQGYQWYKDEELIPGANGQTYVPAENGFYHVEILDANGCTAISEPFEVVLSDLREKSLQSIRIYPNPTKGRLYISNPGKLRFEVTVYSPMGIPVLKNTLENNVESLDLSSFPDGLYQLILEAGSTSIQRKIIVN